MENVNIEIAERIRKTRLIRGMTQEELALACGYTNRATINKIEKGTRTISIETAKKLARALNVDPDYIVFGDTESTKEEIQRIISSLDPSKQEAVLQFLRSMIEDR